MVRSTLLLSALAAVSTAFARPDIKSVKTRVPGAYIFEFEDGHVRTPLLKLSALLRRKCTNTESRTLPTSWAV